MNQTTETVLRSALSSVEFHIDLAVENLVELRERLARDEAKLAELQAQKADLEAALPAARVDA